MTTYYVKNGGSDAAAGTSDATAWATIGKINGFSFSTSDDVYLKCASTFTDASLSIDWGGASGNRAVIGAYYMNGGAETIGVSGAKPIIDRGWNLTTWSPNSNFTPAVEVTNQAPDLAYVTVQDIRVEKVLGRGFQFSRSNNCELLRCECDYIYRCAVFGNIDADNLLVSDCTLTRSMYGRVLNAFAPDTAEDWEFGIGWKRSQNVTVRNNVVDRCGGEGIMAYGFAADSKWSDGALIEDNEVHAAWAVSIYLTYVQNGVVRRNLVYGTTDTDYHRSGAACGNALYMADEENPGRLSGNIFYNNLAAYCSAGLALHVASAGATSCSFYHNTVVDCNTGYNGSGSSFTTCAVKNNIFADYTGTGTMASTVHANLDFNYNAWHSTPTDTDAIGANDVVGAPGLTKISGWRSIAALGGVTYNDFVLQSGSICINTGTDITTYSDEDYLQNTRSGVVDIGALEFGAGANITGTLAVTEATDTSTASGTVTIRNTPVYATPLVPRYWRDSTDHKALMAEAINQSLSGKLNCSGTVTLTPSATTTTITNPLIGVYSQISFMPETANASAEIGGGTMYISSRSAGSAIITHANSAQTDRHFTYTVIA